MDEIHNIIKYWMALSSVKGVGPKTIKKLINRFGSPKAIFSAPAIEIARMLKLNLTLAQEIINAQSDLEFFENFIRQLSKAGIYALCPESLDYPALLKDIDDFPPILYKKGNINDNPAIAIVGTRSPTNNGINVAKKMSRWFVSRGFTIVSGLARGIDTAAHKGALQSGGKTIAVLGSGLKMIYPAENIELARDICDTGAMLSECQINEVVSSAGLIRRNRIISGICSGVILVEPGKSGAINAGYWALKQNRKIFIYNPKQENLLPETLSRVAFPINHLKDLDSVENQLLIEKKDPCQIKLL